ncbi:MAG: hypothetical protein NXH83_08970 [Rhodobacteraceae bacterium]|nr:hypothetical protein [Paracoccaceae bacterium]
MTTRARIPYLERRPQGFLYRRRVPFRATPADPASEGPQKRIPESFFRLSLRTHVASEARDLAMRLTAMFDLAFALVTERAMDHLRPDQIEMLEALARFQIAAHAAARAVAPARSEAAARQAAACEQATQAVLRRALATGDRELARQPLREVAARLGVTLDEETEDWNRLAFEATRVLLDASRVRERQELGEFDEPSPVFRSARTRMDAAGRRTALAWSLTVASAAVPPAVPVTHSAPAAGSVPVYLPIPSVPEPLPNDGSDAGTPPCQEGRSYNPIEPAVAVPSAAPSDPGQDALALRATVRPPKLGNLPLDRLSPSIRQVLREKPRGIRLTEAVQLFDELKSLGYGSEFGQLQAADPVAGANWVRDSRSKTRFALQFWPEFVGDGSFEDIDAGAIRDALEALPRIPKKHGKGVQDWGSQHSFVDLIERSDAWEEHMAAEKLDRLEAHATEADREKAMHEGREPRLRAETVIKHRRHIKAVGEMLLAFQLVDVNPFEVCAVTGKQEKRMKMAEESRSRTVWDDRIHDLFRSPVFQGNLDDPGEPLFWSPLIARLMGLREEEILQLAPDDFGRDSGIDYVDIKRWQGNHVKSGSSERRVPLHPTLIELGLLKLVDLRRREGQSRLFPNLKRGAVKGKFSEVFTKTFTRYRQEHDVYWPGLDFHAFRTTCNGDLMNQDKSDAVRCAIMGHEFQDEGGRSYSQGLGLRTLHERLCDIKLDVSMIKSPFRSFCEGEIGPPHRNGLRVVA